MLYVVAQGQSPMGLPILYGAKHNYDLDDQELLAVRLALEEWWHWLVGPSQSFLAWADHRDS